MKIVFAISEVEELVKTGGLADVGKALPLALHSEGEDVAIVMPYYKSIADTFHLDTICDTQTLFTEGKVYHFDVRALAWHGITVYFVDYPEYFMRDGLYSNAYDAYEDNGERFSFFSGAVLQTLQALSFTPDVIHCHDWHTAMLPYLLNHERSGFFKNRKLFLTLIRISKWL